MGKVTVAVHNPNIPAVSKDLVQIRILPYSALFFRLLNRLKLSQNFRYFAPWLVTSSRNSYQVGKRNRLYGFSCLSTRLHSRRCLTLEAEGEIPWRIAWSLLRLIHLSCLHSVVLFYNFNRVQITNNASATTRMDTQ